MLPIKVQAFPVSKNVIIARFENIADLFDFPSGNISDTNVYLDVNAFANNLWV